MSKKPQPPTPSIDDMVKIYLENVSDASKERGENLELEVKFGTRGYRRITNINYNNVVKKLLSQGFTLQPTLNMLRIFNQYSDPRTGAVKMSNLRTEIEGLGNISKYCKTNTLSENAIFEQKSYFNIGSKTIYPINMDDFNFRVSMQLEKRLNERAPLVSSIIDNWNDNKKTFRYISRNTLTHPDYPIKIDISIVKNSKRSGRNYIPEYKMSDSGVLDSTETYEIEIELDNEKIMKILEIADDPNILLHISKSIKKGIKFVLSGLQETNYPVSYDEQDNVIQEYMKILWKESYKPGMRVYPKNFVGPSQYTLQMQNVVPVSDDVELPNIRKNYTVTEKADGDRKLMIIDKKGKVYLINTNMNVQFTGAKTNQESLYNTIMDGEHILHDKTGKFINLYAAFDVYYINKRDVRALGFVPTAPDEVQTNFRYPLLVNIIKSLNLKSVINNGLSPIRVKEKSFYADSKSQSIFQACNTILSMSDKGLFEYETDGLIFTPADKGVGVDSIGKYIKPIKTTWDYSFKWKPPEFNTIDYLITIKKDTDGRDFIGNIFQDGTNTSIATQLTQYKTLVLRVGYDEAKHGYMNPCQNLIDATFDSVGNKDSNEGYRPMQFFPTNPSDNDAGVCNILLETTPSGDKIMKTIENEVIEDNMIVEFRYIIDGKKGWKWQPLRARYDKTADLRNGGRNFGNAYHVANSNWHSIHNPITSEMIRTGADIPQSVEDSDIYYNVKTGESLTRGLRDFHNKFVKKTLIMKTTKPGNTLIDLAVGKGGDMTKWIAAKLKFVFGIDISRDNIQNRLDGACARYLNFKKKFNRMPMALFVTGNSGVNIRNTDAIYLDKGKQITNAVFGKGAKDIKDLGKGVNRVYGIGESGFDVCSIQFAIHYMFESGETLQNFLRNVSETTTKGGYFIGTSYDGAAIFKMLAKKESGEGVSINEKDKKIWSVTKEYNRQEFPNDESSVGYAINVYQETINKAQREYLVNYDYLTRLMENYGFIPLSREESQGIGLPSGIGMFSELYGLMSSEVERNPSLKREYKSALDMTANERKISFLNKYFIYKKVRNVDASKVMLGLLHKTLDEVDDERKESEKAVEVVEKTEEKVEEETKKQTIKVKKKSKKKLRLKESEK